MEIKEAIEHLDEILINNDKWNGCEECKKEHKQLREWLKELQQYKSIGTLDECKTAREKQIAKTPDYEGDGYSDGQLVYDTWICPNCGNNYEVGYDDDDYCPKCGQHIQHLINQLD